MYVLKSLILFLNNKYSMDYFLQNSQLGSFPKYISCSQHSIKWKTEIQWIINSFISSIYFIRHLTRQKLPTWVWVSLNGRASLGTRDTSSVHLLLRNGSLKGKNLEGFVWVGNKRIADALFIGTCESVALDVVSLACSASLCSWAKLLQWWKCRENKLNMKVW